MTAETLDLTPAQRWLLERADDAQWRRKPDGVDAKTVGRLVYLGLLESKRERGRLGGGIMRTQVRRTAQGRQALGLSPPNNDGVS